MRINHIVNCGQPGYTISFSHYILDSTTLLSETSLISRRIHKEIYHIDIKVLNYSTLYYSTLYSCQILITPKEYISVILSQSLLTRHNDMAYLFFSMCVFSPASVLLYFLRYSRQDNIKKKFKDTGYEIPT